MLSIDELDVELLKLLEKDARQGVAGLALTLGISRNTVHARLQRLTRDGVFLGFSQRISPASLGYPIVGFVSLSISQALGEGMAVALARVPEVIEVHATTGDADYLIKVVARDTGHLHRITNRILAIEGVVRSNTVISLSQVMGNRTRPLLEHRASDQRA